LGVLLSHYFFERLQPLSLILDMTLNYSCISIVSCNLIPLDAFLSNFIFNLTSLASFDLPRCSATVYCKVASATSQALLFENVMNLSLSFYMCLVTPMSRHHCVEFAGSVFNAVSCIASSLLLSEKCALLVLQLIVRVFRTWNSFSKILCLSPLFDDPWNEVCIF